MPSLEQSLSGSSDEGRGFVGGGNHNDGMVELEDGVRSLSSAYSSASSETIRSQTVTSESILNADKDQEELRPGVKEWIAEEHQENEASKKDCVATSSPHRTVPSEPHHTSQSIFSPPEGDLPPTSPPRTRVVPLPLSGEGNKSAYTPCSQRKGLPPKAARSRPNSFRSTFRQSTDVSGNCGNGGGVGGSVPPSLDTLLKSATAEWVQPNGCSSPKTNKQPLSPPSALSPSDQTHGAGSTTPNLPRRSSFRDPATLSKLSSQNQQERRGSLKSFASSLLDRKGSFRTLLGNSTSPLRGSSDSLFSKVHNNSQRLSRTVVTKSTPNVSSKDGYSEKKGSFRNRKGPPPSVPQSPIKKDSGISIGEAFHDNLEPNMTKPRTTSKIRGLGTSGGSLSTESTGTLEFDSSLSSVATTSNMKLSNSGDFSIPLKKEYDIVQTIGEGWFSRVYLAEHRETRQEIVLKAINSKTVSVDDFWREYQHSYLLSAHPNVLTIFDVVFQAKDYYMFATEYAPLGDLTSNVSDRGIGEMNTKRVAKQIGSALEWVHSKKLCHLDVKLDSVLVFKSDFSWVKLCDFGAVRSQGDIVIKKNELLPYCPPELVAKHANEYYQVDKVQDVFQFGIVLFFCLFGILPWQRADVTDPYYSEFFAWRSKKTSKPPKHFKPMTTRSQKLFRKLMDVDPAKRLLLHEIPKYTDDKWLKKVPKSPFNGSGSDPKQISDGISQLTMGSFQSVHSNAVEKNKVLYTLLQHGVETTVDRSQKNSRIINWIQHGQAIQEDTGGSSTLPTDQLNLE
ncbi:hypothetical protein TCAL_00140 [Tigriopus californicus]|uniref:Protein kinase domain-containing protein n=1 Tax=Tigriopus californicus TaxID=6832 RepID=A0A553PI75_TIGCA|nr:hypothetical protein TCAL_00140 [Tigriopus californicus]|eukprot:TCALIF_00140-PA protein Name:"Similar to sbk1 Serine/threonine-protein kinase SBK1 (Danio rerio)" AED:0.08 eAED:0.09 QI:132/0/0.5/1/1/1/2/0/788